MPFSHHSHSGQFCGHGEDTLEEVVQAAIGKKMQVFALTEHMPREERDLYPEEVLLSLRHNDTHSHDHRSNHHILLPHFPSSSMIITMKLYGCRRSTLQRSNFLSAWKSIGYGRRRKELLKVF